MKIDQHEFNLIEDNFSFEVRGWGGGLIFRFEDI